MLFFRLNIPLLFCLLTAAVATIPCKPGVATQKGAWKPLVLSRQALSAATTASSHRNSQCGDRAERRSPDNFGEKVLATGITGRSRGGDWRVPAATLLRHCCRVGREREAEADADADAERAVEEARPQDVESFFNELGLGPTPTISSK